MDAYEDAIRETSTDDAPWYVIPADNKYLATARGFRGGGRGDGRAQAQCAKGEEFAGTAAVRQALIE